MEGFTTGSLIIERGRNRLTSVSGAGWSRRWRLRESAADPGVVQIGGFIHVPGREILAGREKGIPSICRSADEKGGAFVAAARYQPGATRGGIEDVSVHLTVRVIIRQGLRGVEEHEAAVLGGNAAAIPGDWRKRLVFPSSYRGRTGDGPVGSAGHALKGSGVCAVEIQYATTTILLEDVLTFLIQRIGWKGRGTSRGRED